MAILKLTIFTEHSLRTLAYLANHTENYVSIHAVAEAHGSSINHLSKVVSHLASLGYIETRRGKHGGLRLCVPPADIKLGDMIRQTEDRAETVLCLQPLVCMGNCQCHVRGIIHDALEAAVGALNARTIADLVAASEGRMMTAPPASPNPEGYD
jgi:Rrf2 family transcriptional regulator, nitric oxide-sensitive transcriptional repressor